MPFLYSKSIIVNSLPHLLQHTTDAPASLQGKITPKIDRIKLVRSLRLCALGPFLNAKWSVIGLLEQGDFSLVAEGETGKVARFIKQGIEECVEFLAFFEAAASKGLPRLYLESLTIGQAGRTEWRSIMSSPEVASRVLTLTSDSIVPYSRYVSNLGVRHICTYQRFGPYSLAVGYRLLGGPQPTFNIHHWGNDVFRSLFLGARIRHFFERFDCSTAMISDGTFAAYMNLPWEAHLCELQNLLTSTADSLPAHQQPLMSETIHEIYGLFACVPGGELLVPDSDEDGMIQAITSVHLQTIPEARNKMVSFHKRDATPCCEACGWDPKRHDFDWAKA